MPAVEVNRPWQFPIGEQRTAPSAPSLGSTASSALRRQRAADPAGVNDESNDRIHRTLPRGRRAAGRRLRGGPRGGERGQARESSATSPGGRSGPGSSSSTASGRSSAGQTLLDWTRPIIQLLRDAPAADPGLVVPLAAAGTVRDPVIKSNIDFSGETFPVIQVGVPRRSDVADDDPRAKERTWVFTEAWWASEVRAPSLATMISWLGEQGGVGRIVQGIQENKLSGRWAILGRISLQPIVSVADVVHPAALRPAAGDREGHPVRAAARRASCLRLAASFLTDWFGGARTLLRDAGQSANVRYRLLIDDQGAPGVRLPGRRDHCPPGGTMVSLTTLTDPAFAGPPGRS